MILWKLFESVYRVDLCVGTRCVVCILIKIIILLIILLLLCAFLHYFEIRVTYTLDNELENAIIGLHIDSSR